MRSEASKVDGLLDTNVIIHALANDSHSAECRRFVDRVENGTTTVWLEPAVLHEISYALPRYLKQLSRHDIAQTLVSILNWKGVRREVESMRRAVNLWADNPGLAFVDAYLAALSLDRELPIFTKNAGELNALGARVLSPLPGTEATQLETL